MLALTSSAHESGVCTPGSTGFGESFPPRGRSFPYSNKTLPSAAAEKPDAQVSSSSSSLAQAHARGTPRSGGALRSEGIRSLLDEQKMSKATLGRGTENALLTSSSEDDDDDDTEFFECEDQEVRESERKRFRQKVLRNTTLSIPG